MYSIIITCVISWLLILSSICGTLGSEDSMWSNFTWNTTNVRDDIGTFIPCYTHHYLSQINSSYIALTWLTAHGENLILYHLQLHDKKWTEKDTVHTFFGRNIINYVDRTLVDLWMNYNLFFLPNSGSCKKLSIRNTRVISYRWFHTCEFPPRLMIGSRWNFWSDSVAVELRYCILFNRYPNQTDGTDHVWIPSYIIPGETL